MKFRILLLVFFVSFAAFAGEEWSFVRGKCSMKQPGEITGFGAWKRVWKTIPGKDYLFTAEVCSDSAVKFTIGNPKIRPAYWKKIAYQQTGKIQKILGFYNSKNAAELTVTMSIEPVSSASKGNTSIQNVSLKQVDFRRKTPERRAGITGVTRFAEGDVIVVPEGEAFKKAAEKIRKKLHPGMVILSDKELCEKGTPKIRKEYENRNLVILGNLDLNKAIWAAYGSMLAASDAWYPGPNGYEIRTACNVLRNGKNHIIIGSSSTQGVLKAAELFLSMAKPELPYLMKIKLDGACKAAVNADIARWKSFPKGDFPQKEAGYHTIRRWFHHAIGWYWTNEPFYRTMAQKFLPPVLADNAYTHHYIMEWLFRTWRMVEMTDLHTPEQKRAMEKLLFANFMELQTGADLFWMRHWSPPYNKVVIQSRHVTAPLMDLIETSDYVRNTFVLNGELKELADFVFDESFTMMRNFARISRFDSYPGEQGGGGLEELALSVFRFHLKYGLYDFFTSGKAKDWSYFEFRDYASNRNHLMLRVFFNDWLPASILGAWYKEGKYHYYRDTSRFNKESQKMFDDRYVCRIGTWQSAVPPVMPPEELRMSVSLLNSKDAGTPELMTRGFWKLNPETLKQNPTEMVVFHGKHAPGELLLALSGTGRCYSAPGEIVAFSTKGAPWLHNSWSALYSYGPGTPFEKNMLYVSREKQRSDGKALCSAIGNLAWSGENASSQGAALAFTPWNGVKWTRSIVKLENQSFLVYDRAEALTDDNFDLAVIWKPMQNPLPAEENTLVSKMGKQTFRITCAGNGFALETNNAAWLKKEASILNNRFAFHGNLKAGEIKEAFALLQIDSDLKIQHTGNGRVMLFRKGQPVSEFRFTDTGFCEVSRQRISTLGDGKLVIGKEKMLVGNAIWNLSKSVMYADGKEPVKIPDSRSKKMRGIVKGMLNNKVLSNAAAHTAVSSSIPEHPLTKLWSAELFKTGQKIAPWGFRLCKNFDLGETVTLSEIRNLQPQEKLPAFIEYSEDGKIWKQLDLARTSWIPGALIRNYGETHPMEKWINIAVLASPVRARYVRTQQLQRLAFFRSDKTSPCFMPKIIAVTPNILVTDGWYKTWPRRYHEEKSSIVNMDDSGRVLWTKMPEYGLHDLKVLDWPETHSIAAVTSLGKVEFFNQAGRKLKTLDLNADMAAFHRKYGRHGVRQPAGGFTACYSIGTWRNPLRPVVSRYGQTAFYNPDGTFEGTHSGGGYSTPAMLDRGVDLTGKGMEEMLVLAPNYLCRFSGPDAAQVRTGKATGVSVGGSPVYWPEVYERKAWVPPTSWNVNLGTWGPKVLALEIAAVNGKKYPMVITQTYLAIYDPEQFQPVYIRVPLSSFIAGTAAAGKLLIAQADGTLLYTELKGNLRKLAFGKIAVPGEIRSICADSKGHTLLAGNEGVFQLEKGKLIRRVSGNFCDIKIRNDHVITAECSGRISCFRLPQSKR